VISSFFLKKIHFSATCSFCLSPIHAGFSLHLIEKQLHRNIFTFLCLTLGSGCHHTANIVDHLINWISPIVTFTHPAVSLTSPPIPVLLFCILVVWIVGTKTAVAAVVQTEQDLFPVTCHSFLPLYDMCLLQASALFVNRCVHAEVVLMNLC